MTFPEKLLALRRQNSLSQEELAERLDVSRQAVSRWEGGTAMPDATNLLQLSRLFGVSTDYLLDDSLAEPAPVSLPQTRFSAAKLAGIISCAAGALGLLIIAVLSTMIEVRIGGMVPEENGWYTYATKPGYDLLTFISQYRLGALVVILILLVVAGTALLCPTGKRRFMGYAYCGAAIVGILAAYVAMFALQTVDPAVGPILTLALIAHIGIALLHSDRKNRSKGG